MHCISFYLAQKFKFPGKSSTNQTYQRDFGAKIQIKEYLLKL